MHDDNSNLDPSDGVPRLVPPTAPTRTPTATPPPDEGAARPRSYRDASGDAPWWVHTDIEGNYEKRELVDAATLEREPPSLLRRALMLALVYFTLLTICGPFTGPQATFGALERRGVYSGECDARGDTNAAAASPKNSTAAPADSAPLHCPRQQQAIESAADLALSASTFTMLFWGLAKDILGARRVAVGAIALWTVTTAASGFNAADGTLWLVLQSIAASAGTGAYSALGLVHLKQACASEHVYGIAGFLASATWDASVMLNFGLAELFEWQELTLWQAYAVYAAVIGIPVTIGFIKWPKTPDEEAAEAEEAALSSAPGSRVGTPAVPAEGAFPRSARSAPTPRLPTINSQRSITPPRARMPSRTLASSTYGSFEDVNASRDTSVARSRSANPSPIRTRAVTVSPQPPQVVVAAENDRDRDDTEKPGRTEHSRKRATTPQRRRPAFAPQGPSKSNHRSATVTPEPPQLPAEAYSKWAARRAAPSRGTRTSLVSLGSATTVTSNTRAGRAIARTMKDARAIMRKSSYWLFVAHLTAIVTLGCFVIANVGSVALAHGYADTERAQAVSTYMMAGLGVTCVAPGRLIQRLGVQRGIAAVMVALIALLLGVAGVGAFGGRGAAALYGNLALLFMWRVWGYGLGFSYMSWRFGAHPHGIGFCYGVVYGVAGLVSMGAGEVAGAALHRDPEGMLRPVMLALGGAALVVEVAFLVHVVRVRTDGGEVREAERARLERVGLLSRVNAEWASQASDRSSSTHSDADTDARPASGNEERQPLVAASEGSAPLTATGKTRRPVPKKPTATAVTIN